MKKQGLHYKLIKAFLLQIALISLATLLGVFSAEKIVEKILVRQALVGEAEYFWQHYRNNPKLLAPNTLNLKGYLAVDQQDDAIPLELRALQPGYFRAQFNGHHPIVYIEDQGNARLYLIFDEQQITALAFYFGVVPLSLVLILIYWFAWLAYQQTRKAISPIIQLAQVVDKFDFRSQSLAQLDLATLRQTSDSDVVKLIDALSHFTRRMEQFIQREKNFTRDASHELRTPLAVIKSALALLKKRQDYQTNEQRSLQLIDTTVGDMGGLIETLLLLAREDVLPLDNEDVLINDLLMTLVERLNRTLGRAGLKVEVQQHCLIALPVAEKVLSILFTNLLKNAYSYTPKGTILISIYEQQVSVTDTGVGMTQQQLEQVFEPFYRVNYNSTDGHGLGLSIVQQLCLRYRWKLKIWSKLGEGTKITVLFPKARLLGGIKTS